jgi:hypothetical protein
MLKNVVCKLTGKVRLQTLTRSGLESLIFCRIYFFSNNASAWQPIEQYFRSINRAQAAYRSFGGGPSTYQRTRADRAD